MSDVSADVRHYLVTQSEETRNVALINSLFNFRLCLAYPFYCLLSKRLHASGKSALWAVFIILLFLGLSFAVQVSISIYYASTEEYIREINEIIQRGKQSDTDQDVMDQLLLHHRQVLKRTYLPVIYVYLVFLCVGCAILSRVGVKAKYNKYRTDYFKAFD